MSDITGLNELVRDLTAEPGKIQRKAPVALTAGAKAVQAKWRQQASGLRHAPAYPASITFDVKWKGSAVEAEIGPDKDRAQGALGNLITYGSVNSPPHAHDIAALQEAGPQIDRAFEGLVDL